MITPRDRLEPVWLIARGADECGLRTNPFSYDACRRCGSETFRAVLNMNACMHLSPDEVTLEVGDIDPTEINPIQVCCQHCGLLQRWDIEVTVTPRAGDGDPKPELMTAYEVMADAAARNCRYVDLLHK